MQIKIFLTAGLRLISDTRYYMNVRIEDGWRRRLESEWTAPYFADLAGFVREAYSAGTVYPPAGKVFAAFDACPFDDVKVVILGQDPYHEPGQANGLCFSVADGVQQPPSLVNIFKEIRSDLGVVPYASGDLSRWARQGVLLLNATLTVRAGSSNAHANCGWQEFTDFVIKTLGAREKPLAFVLWGRNAQMIEPLIGRQHYIVKSAHPSPMSATNGFFGSKPFSRVNSFLAVHGMTPVDWTDVTADNAPSYYNGTGKIIRG